MSDLIGSVNDAKAALRKIQEKIFGETVDTNEIFTITVELNNFLDAVAVNMNEENKNK